ncbi:hypothetical protein HII12_000940 [Brettanomyces bruxellensis]|uniref:Dystroglycan-type cadherin-like domain-containing protein n=1 Tax=Dekkera bruxellensis TaxID=5007 RepID=A0A8H6EZ22_DEKBR|nr:hypothetical protein HII12_000940 [Brettanomyces bruxellensis]
MLTSAETIIALPFDQQLPDVARVGEPYTFELSSETFRSDSGNVVYSASGLPSWLSFDPSTLTFSGTPDNAQNVSFTLTGTDDSQSSTSEQCDIIVSDKIGPRLKSEEYLYQQLAESGNTNGYDGFVLKSQEKFMVSFSKDTFNSNNSTIVAYYATDYAGYSAAYGNFHLIVGGHYLVYENNSTLLINSTAGKNFSEKIPLDSVYLDGTQINTSNISSVQLNDGPEWVSVVDNNTLVGNVPKNADSTTSMNVTVTDVYGDNVFISFEVEIANKVFTIKTLPNVNATRGTFFNYTISNSTIQSPGYTKLTASYSESNSTEKAKSVYYYNKAVVGSDSTSDWLEFHTDNNTFNGWVPDKFKSTQVALKGQMNDLTETRYFDIIGVGTVSSSSTSSSTTGTLTSSSAPTATSSKPSATSVAHTSHSSDVNRKLAIGLGVSLPILAIIIAAGIFYCCWKRRHYKDNDAEKDVMTVSNTPNGNAGGPVGGDNESNATLSSPDTSGQKTTNDNTEKMDSGSNGSTSSSMTNVDASGKNLNTSMSGTIIKSRSNAGGFGSNKQGSGSFGQAKSKSHGSDIVNSWRRTSGKANWRPRDSLNSLATVTTNDLLTMNVVDDPNLQRRSQMNLILQPGTSPDLNGNNLSNTNLITSYRNSRVKSIARSTGVSSSNPDSEENGAGASVNTSSPLTPSTTQQSYSESAYYSVSDPSSNIELLTSTSSQGSNDVKDGDHTATTNSDSTGIGTYSSSSTGANSSSSTTTSSSHFPSSSSSSAQLVNFNQRRSPERRVVTPTRVDDSPRRGVIEN